MKLERPVCFLRWSSLLSNYMGGSSLHVEDEVENLHVVLKTGGVLPMFTRSELS